MRLCNRRNLFDDNASAKPKQSAGKVVVTLTCPEEACTVALSGKTKGKKGKPLALKAKSVDLVAVYSSPDLSVDDPTFRAAVESSLAAVHEELSIQTTTWYDDPQPSLLGDDGHATRVLITLPGRGDAYIPSMSCRTWSHSPGV